MHMHAPMKRRVSQAHLASHTRTRLAFAELMWERVEDVVEGLHEVLEGGECSSSRIAVLASRFVRKRMKPALSYEEEDTCMSYERRIHA
jgi:hypothetical protein